MDSIRMPTGCEDIFADEDSGPLWPQWLEAFRVPDGPRAAAYEGTPAHLRAAIKTALALHQAHAGEMDSRTCRDERFPRRGFRRMSTDGPAPFALVAFPASLRSPARLAAAALMPAILAGVPLTGAFCLGGEPTPEALVTLELAGVEDAFALPAADFARLAGELPWCRVVLLHGLDGAALPGARQAAGPHLARRRPCPCSCCRRTLPWTKSCWPSPTARTARHRPCMVAGRPGRAGRRAFARPLPARRRAGGGQKRPAWP